MGTPPLSERDYELTDVTPIHNTDNSSCNWVTFHYKKKEPINSKIVISGTSKTFN